MTISHPDMRTVDGKGADKSCNGTFGEPYILRLPNYSAYPVRTCGECGYHLPMPDGPLEQRNKLKGKEITCLIIDEPHQPK